MVMLVLPVQGLLSLNAFVGDLQYKCWVRAMLPGGNDDGKEGRIFAIFVGILY